MTDKKIPHQPTDDLTRRQWILRLSELIALSGVSGFVPEFAEAFALQDPQHLKPVPLPPGLYEPSQDHLVHALSSGGKHWVAPSGSETGYLIETNAPYQPQFFSAQEFPVVTRLMNILLGDVDAAALSQSTKWFDQWLHSSAGVRAAAQQLIPMHRALAVAFYGENAVREIETAHPDAIARAGMRALQDLSQKLYCRDFLQLTQAEQVELVTTTAEAQPGTSVRKLFELTRREAARGYYTSAAGLKELDYHGNAYYGDSPGCEPKS